MACSRQINDPFFVLPNEARKDATAGDSDEDEEEEAANCFAKELLINTADTNQNTKR